jgi:anti-anti-sigma regulatory factor
MPYHVSLTNSREGEQRYLVTIVDALDAATARHLGDWIEAALLNPEAGFAVDISQATEIDPAALRRLLARHTRLSEAHRLEVRSRPQVPARLLTLPAALPSIEAVLALAS